jgi:hypothetical protein
MLVGSVVSSAPALVRPGGGPGDPAGLAATLLHALVRERPLGRGNDQVALAAMLQFLALNGWGWTDACGSRPSSRSGVTHSTPGRRWLAPAAA